VTEADVAGSRCPALQDHWLLTYAEIVVRTSASPIAAAWMNQIWLVTSLTTVPLPSGPRGLMEAVAEHGVSVVLSSHLVADLERVCDYLVVLVASRVRAAGEVSTLLASHHRLSGPRRDPGALPAGIEVIEESHTDKQSTLLVRTVQPVHDPSWTVTPVGLEDLVLGYMSGARDDRTHRLQVAS